MTDLEITDEAIAAQRAYDAAGAEVQRVLDLQPPPVAIAAKEAEISDDQRKQVQQARDARMAALHALRAAREQIGGNPVTVQAAVRKAARQGQEA